ncbi:TPA: hypothetical protein EYP37_02525 [Candidatus Poribacteria bacterium]|nr:hypothetical protein [Candidatus Poribacteria bacterium]
MTRLVRLLILLILLPVPSQAAFNLDFVGAESAGMGGVASLEGSVGGIMLDPTLLISIRSQQIALSGIDLYPRLKGGMIARTLTGYANVGSEGGIGIAWGYLNAAGLYSENMLTVAAVRSFGRFALGGALSAMEWDVPPTTGPGGVIIEDINGPILPSFSLGIRLKPSSGTSLSLSLLNLNRPNVASSSSTFPERLPLIARLGVTVTSEKGRWGMDLVFRGGEIDIRTGFERRLADRISIRAGLRLENLAMGINLTGGIGYRLNDSTRVNYALIYPMINLQGGMESHCASVIYDF